MRKMAEKYHADASGATPAYADVAKLIFDVEGGSIEARLKSLTMTQIDGMNGSAAMLIAQFEMQAINAEILLMGQNKCPARRETLETSAVVTRVAPSFIRFGHFEHFSHHGHPEPR